MPVAGNEQPYGLLHGGATCALMETIGSWAAALHAGPDKQVVGIELNASYLRGGDVRRRHRRLHAGAPRPHAGDLPHRDHRRERPADRDRPADLPDQGRLTGGQPSAAVGRPRSTGAPPDGGAAGAPVGG